MRVSKREDLNMTRHTVNDRIAVTYTPGEAHGHPAAFDLRVYVEGERAREMGDEEWDAVLDGLHEAHGIENAYVARD